MTREERLMNLANRYRDATPVKFEQHAMDVDKEYYQLISLLAKTKDGRGNSKDIADIIECSSKIIALQHAMIEELHHAYIEDSLIIQEFASIMAGNNYESVKQKPTTLPN